MKDIRYSRTDVNINTLRKANNLLYEPQRKTTIIAPKPYIGQYGPIRKPGMNKLCVTADLYITSRHQPITLQIMKMKLAYLIFEHISFSNFSCNAVCPQYNK